MSEQERYLGRNFAEFLGGIQFIADKTQVEMAYAFDCTQQTYGRWLRGGIPYPTFQAVIGEIFELTDAELRNLRSGSEALRNGNEGSRTPREQFLGAFVMRAQTGPPLNEVEAELVRFLIDSSEET